MIEKTPIQLIDEIDERLYDGIKRRISRMSVEWGKWSREMNLYTRSKIENVSNLAVERQAFMYTFQYWVCASKLLELNFKSKILGGAKKNRLKKEMKELRRMISGEAPIGTTGFEDFASMVREKVLGG